MSPNQISFNHYRELRVKADLEDDPDYAGADYDTPPSAGDVVVLRAPGGGDPRVPTSLKVQVVVEWLDNSSSPVLGQGRGSFDIQAIHVTDRQSPLSGGLVTDSTVLRGQVAHRPIVIDEVMSGDSFTVRLSNLDIPHESVVRARVLYREMV